MNIRIFLLLLLLAAFETRSQTTAFSYQGSLTDGGNPANGSFQMQFKLFDAASGGFQIGPTLNDVPVSASAGMFGTRLDFGANPLSGANRWLEIAVRRTSGESYVTLSPREQIASSPYAVRTMSAATADVATNAINASVANNALNLGGQPAVQFVQTNDARLSDARSPLPGSGSYIQNTATQQSSSNFNISGDGTVGGTVTGSVLSGTLVNASNQYNLGGNRILSTAGTENLFAGVGAGNVNAGSRNSFFGFNAGLSNTSGQLNAFFGRGAGQSNLAGSQNSFFGSHAGSANTAGNANAFFGYFAGTSNTQGFQNSFFGVGAGAANTTGNNNTFFGFNAGQSNTNGEANAFFGHSAGQNSINFFNSFFGFQAGINTTSGFGNTFIGTLAGGNNIGGQNNTVVGTGTNLSSANATFETVIGAGATGSGSSTVTLGRPGDDVVVPHRLSAFRGLVGIGIGSNRGVQAQSDNGPGLYAYSFTGYSAEFHGTGSILVKGQLHVEGYGSGSTPVCRNGIVFSNCSSSIRYKTSVKPFLSGLDLVHRLRPVSYNWKVDGTSDVGLIAEEVAALNSNLVTRNEKGEIEGVKYDRLTIVFVNAIKEQQSQLQEQHEQIRKQQTLIDALKDLICSQNLEAEICREN